MSWLETLWLADVLSSDKKTARKKINWFVGIFFILIGVFIALAFVLATTGKDSEKEQALKIIFIQHIMPKTLQEGYKTDNMDKAITEEIAYLQGKKSPLYKELVLIQQNYQEFLANNGRECVLSDKNNRVADNKYLNEIEIETTNTNQTGIVQLENPYYETIESMIAITNNKNTDIVLPPLKNNYSCIERQP